MTPAKAQVVLADNVRKRRLVLGLTQAGLSKRSGVALSTLRKFEQTGAASIESLLKLMLVVGGLEQMLEACAPENIQFKSIDDVLSEPSHSVRQRGSRS